MQTARAAMLLWVLPRSVGYSEDQMSRVETQPGLVFELNNASKHTVYNGWDRPRIHLILDYVDEADAVVNLLSAHQDALWANLAGHLHVDSSMNWDRAGIEVHVTDATWDDVNRVRVVDVSSSETQVSYDHWIVDVL